MGAESWAQVLVAVVVPLMVSILTAIAIVAFRQGKISSQVDDLRDDVKYLQGQIETDTYNRRH